MASTSENANSRFRYPEVFSEDAKAIYREICTEYDLNKAELVQLKEYCRVITRLDWLNAELEDAPAIIESKMGPATNPLIVEARLTGALAAKLYAALRIPEEDGSRPQRRGGVRGPYGLKAVR